MITTEFESNSILTQAPSVLLIGSQLTGLIKIIDSIISRHESGSDLEKSRIAALEEEFPDLGIYDGRESKVEAFRKMRQDSTILPSIWSRRYFVISYLDRVHYTVPQTLLKLIEEPPDHLSIIMLTDNSKKIPATISSRSLIIPSGYSNLREVLWWLEYRGKDELEIRSQCCGGDLDVAENLEIHTLKNWMTHWSGLLVGLDLPAFFPEFWTEKLEDASESTQISLWIYLGNLIKDSLASHTLWKELGLLTLDAKDCIKSGTMNKIYMSTFILKAYALAKTIKNRVKS